MPHLHLVDQQEIIFRQYLSSRKIVKLRGANTVESRVPLECILEQNDVVIMTPQVSLMTCNGGDKQQIRNNHHIYRQDGMGTKERASIPEFRVTAG